MEAKALTIEERLATFIALEMDVYDTSLPNRDRIRERAERFLRRKGDSRQVRIGVEDGAVSVELVG